MSCSAVTPVVNVKRNSDLSEGTSISFFVEASV
jgi:hypothetical protein